MTLKDKLKRKMRKLEKEFKTAGPIKRSRIVKTAQSIERKMKKL